MQTWKIKIRKRDRDSWRAFEGTLEVLEPFIRACLKEPNKFYLLPKPMVGPDGLLIVVVCLFFGDEDFRRTYRYGKTMLSEISATSNVGRVIHLYENIFNKEAIPFSVFFACYPTDEKTRSLVSRYRTLSFS